MQNVQTEFTLENVLIAIARANDRWAKKTGSTGECEDLKTARKFWDEKLCVFAAGMLKRARIGEIDFLATIADNMGVKAVKRVSEFFACLHSKDYAMLDGLSALHAGATTRSALVFATTGKGDDMTSDVVSDIALVRKLQKVMRKVGVTTEPTQNSRSFGANGFCKYLNMGKMVKVKGSESTIEVNAKSPFVAAIAKMVEQASEETLSLVKGAKKAGE